MDAKLDQKLWELSRKTPVPVIWMIGKTQSGKTSIIRYLTGASEAEIGQGFAPCTRTSREFQFPTAEVPVLRFLDTRGLEEPGYDATEDLKAFDKTAQVVVLTVKLLDHAIAQMLPHLKKIRESKPNRPVILAITCLHEAYPQEQHPQPYPFDKNGELVHAEVARSLARHKQELAGLVDDLIPIDFTKPEEGFHEPHYGGEQFTQALIRNMPEAYRQSLITLEKMSRSLQEHYARKALPYLMAYSSMAATAAAFPIPWVDMLVIPGIQTQMIHHLARLYGQSMSGKRFLELAGTLGLGLLVRQAIREFTKFIPIFGSAMSAVLAGSSTFALGKAFCYYYSEVLEGHMPSAKDLKKYYHEQLTLAEQFWKKRK